MSSWNEMDDSKLQILHDSLLKQYKDIQDQKLKLDMSRGKPCNAQLDLSTGLINCLGETDYKSSDGVDCRNYGGLDGIPDVKKLLAWILEVDPGELILGGNSSLTIMYDFIARAMLRGLPGSELPWGKLPEVKFLCPSPGYDRHFAICEYFGITMIPVPYVADGPDMDQIEQLAADDPTIKGIWCVPKYSNPTGITYSDGVVERLAKMPVKAGDFRIFWDNAYAIHHLTEAQDRLLNILEACKKAGHPDRAILFGSTSKISFAGAGIAMIAGSETNMNWLKKQLAIQTIGPDKLNQLRHLRFFKDRAGIEAHMRRHAAIIKPKFDMVLATLNDKLGGKALASWSNPHGGYFISLNTLPGCAQEVIAKAGQAGVVLTNAGATFPYGKDPEDRNIRIAPTFPPMAELQKAMELVAVCIELVSAGQELRRRGLLPS